MTVGFSCASRSQTVHPVTVTGIGIVELGVGPPEFLRRPLLGRRDELGGDEGAGEGPRNVQVGQAQGLDGLGLGRKLRQGLLAAEHGGDAGHGRAGGHGVLGGEQRDAEHFAHLLLVAVVSQALVQHV